MKMTLSEILPEALRGDENFLAIAYALDRQIQKLIIDLRQVLHLPRLDELSGKVLDLLAWQFHVDNYTPLWLSDSEKRALIRDSIKQHRLRGTRFAVENGLQKLIETAKISEWFEYGSAPYHFKAEITADFMSDDILTAVKKIIRQEKNVRSWCDDIDVLVYPSNIADIAIANIAIAADSEIFIYPSNIADIAIANIAIAADSDYFVYTSNIADIAIANIAIAADSDYFVYTSNIADIAIAADSA